MMEAREPAGGHDAYSIYNSRRDPVLAQGWGQIVPPLSVKASRDDLSRVEKSAMGAIISL